jgi:hypothetical protein
MLEYREQRTQELVCSESFDLIELLVASQLASAVVPRFFTLPEQHPAM